MRTAQNQKSMLVPDHQRAQNQRVNILATNDPGVCTYVDEHKAEQNVLADSTSSWTNSYALTEGWTKLANCGI